MNSSERSTIVGVVILIRKMLKIYVQIILKGDYKLNIFPPTRVELWLVVKLSHTI